jgi:WD40 repeat protein
MYRRAFLKSLTGAVAAALTAGCGSASPRSSIRLRATSVRYRPDGAFLAAGAEGTVEERDHDGESTDREKRGEIRLLATQEGARGVAIARGDGVLDLAWRRDGSLLATADEDRKVRLYNGSTGELLRELSNSNAAFWSTDFSGDGALVAGGGRDALIRVWRVSDGTLLQTLQGHTDAVRSLSFAPDSGLLASAGGADQKVIVWDPRSGETRRILPTVGRTFATAYSPDGNLLLADDENVVNVWDARTYQLLRTLRGHRDVILDIEFTQDSRTVATGSYDGTIRMWDPVTGAERRVIQAGDIVNGVTFSPDGLTVAAARNDGGILIFDVPSGDFLNEIRFYPGV